MHNPKKLDSNSSSKNNSYWIDRDLSSNYFCPNLSLFRLIQKVNGSLYGKKVLEIGFQYGADLMECKRRGADIVGLDINPKYVKKMQAESGCDVRVFSAGIDDIPFDSLFDLIYSRGTIGYLTEDEHKHFFLKCAEKIKSDGRLIIHFVETDLKLKPKSRKDAQNFDVNFLNNCTKFKINMDSNPISFLDADKVIKSAEFAGFNFFCSKLMMQSYDLNEEEFRVDRYLVFSKSQ